MTTHMHKSPATSATATSHNLNQSSPVTHFQALSSDNLVMLNIWTKNGIPESWLKRNFLGWSFAWLDEQGNRNPLRSWVPFEGQRNTDWKPASQDVRPVQGSSWFHYDPQPKAQYQVSPVFGTAENPQVDLSEAVVSNSVDVNGNCGSYLNIASNRGSLLTTQWAARTAPKDSKGGPSQAWIRQAVGEPNNPIRVRMAGNILPTIQAFFQRAHDIGGKLVGGIYEFTDKEVRAWAIDLAKSKGGGLGDFTKPELERLAVVLSGAGDNDAENAETRKMLHEVSDEIWDRFVKKGHIGHNKFWILLDKKSKPIAVLTGCTNFTPTGLCGQSNFVWVIDDARVASRFLEYWEQLRTDTEKSNSEQGPDLRAFCHQKFEFEFEDGTKLVLFFSPNTLNEARGAELPIDLAYVRDELLPLADESILFAFFMPGHPSLIDLFMDKAKENQNLVVRGVVSSPASMPDATQLFHRNGDEPVVVPATAFQKDFGDFERELLSLGFAIIHLKKFVINMFGKSPIVGGGSHNGGQRASTFNDENMEIWIGNRPLALKVGVYILSLYRHYRERYLMSKQASAFSGFLKKDNSWIDAQEWTPGTAKCREKALFAGAISEFDDPAYAVKGESQPGDGITTGARSTH